MRFLVCAEAHVRPQGQAQPEAGAQGAQGAVRGMIRNAAQFAVRSLIIDHASR
jgi:hypothetical protein